MNRIPMYARAVDYLEKRKYGQALEILRPYEDVNTAIAYMSLGYDKAALRILEQSSQTAETQYMQAILNCSVWVMSSGLYRCCSVRRK